MTEQVKGQKYSKGSAVEHWESLPDGMPYAVTPIDTKHKGSTFDQCAIRVTGPKEFIDSFLSNNKGLLEHENESSRIDIVYMESYNTERNRETGEIKTLGLSGAWVCYIKVKSRGRGQGKRGKKNGNGTDSTIEIPIKEVKRETNKNEDMSEYKKVNAGLILRDKLRAQAKKKAGAIGSKNDPLFAVGIADDQEDCGYSWTEPEDGNMPMTTYEDLVSCNMAIENLKRTPAFKKTVFAIVEVWKDAKGKLHCNE